MPQQLIYTSAPRGIVAGRSGHCTVARSASMREAVMLQLERFCYYQHLSLSGGHERPIFACRIMDIRGARFHVLSRIQDAGLDFTGRTNFIAHHLVFAPDEIRQNALPPVILRDWSGWAKSWTTEPQLLENEDWSGLLALAAKSNVPAVTWKRVTGDAANGYGLLETRSGASFLTDDQSDEIVLGLIGESLELLEVRDSRKDFRAAAWQYTFTTSIQEQDNPADFRWRCIHSDNPAANKFAAADCRPLSALRATKLTDEESALARTGRQPPRFVVEPQDVRITEGEAARLTAKAEGVPAPSYQWYSVDRANNGQILPGETKSELLLSNPPLGVSRYIVTISNSRESVQSNVATLSVEKKLKLAQTKLAGNSYATASSVPYHVRSAEDIERNRRRLNVEKAQQIYQRRLRRNKILVETLAIALIAASAIVGWIIYRNKTAEKSREVSMIPQAKRGTNPQKSSGKSREPAKSSQFHEGADPLPSPWTWKNIGNTSTAKTPLNNNGTFTIVGTGRIFSGTNDTFFFASQPVSNSVEFSVCLLNVSPGTNACQCGIMMRKSNLPDAPFVFLGVSSTNIIYTQRTSRGTSCKTENVSIVKFPLYLQLRHNADFLIAGTSPNGKKEWNWKTNTISMTGTNYLLGFAVTSGKPDSEVNARFAHIAIKTIESKK